MPTVPFRNMLVDDDESQSGLESQSGIFTTDGQSTVNHNYRGPGGALLDHGGTRGYDTTLDESMISGIDDASFIMNESVFKAKVKDEEKMIRDEYSLDDSSLDLGDYINMPNITNKEGTKAEESKNAKGTINNPTSMEDSVFSGAYNRVMKTFLFQGKSKASVETSDEESQGKSTPKTLSAKESQEMEVFQAEPDNDDQSNDTTSVGRPTTIILGKAASPRTPQQRLDDYNKKMADTPRTASSSVMTTVSETKILGLRLSRLVFIVLFILVAAVAVAVGSALASQKQEPSSASRESEIGYGSGIFPTNSPVAAENLATMEPTVYVEDKPDDDSQLDENETPEQDSVVSETMAPSSDPVVSETMAPSSPITNATIASDPVSTSAPSEAPTGALTTVPTVETMAPTTGPTVTATGIPTVALDSNTTEAPLGCGADDEISTFVLFGEQRTCPWFRGTNPTFQDFFCKPEYGAYWICRATCQNCLEAPTGKPTLQPSLAPTVPTNVPSLSPSGRTMQQVIMPAAPASTAAALEVENSPQAQALRWMMDEEATVMVLPDFRVQQLFAAATLAYATNLGGGAGNRRWLNGYDECNFIGVTCDEDSGLITEIDVSARDRGGQLPEEVAMFTSLRSFIGRRNRYTGPIPEGFGFLPNLQFLLLDQNALVGNIPQSFVNLADTLLTLTVDRNELSGEFPNVILSQLTSIQMFSSFGNELTGDIDDSVCALPFIQSLVTGCENEGCYTQCIED